MIENIIKESVKAEKKDKLEKDTKIILRKPIDVFLENLVKKLEESNLYYKFYNTYSSCKECKEYVKNLKKLSYYFLFENSNLLVNKKYKINLSEIHDYLINRLCSYSKLGSCSKPDIVFYLCADNLNKYEDIKQKINQEKFYKKPVWIEYFKVFNLVFSEFEKKQNLRKHNFLLRK